MKKGFYWSVSALFAVILGIVAAAIGVAVISGDTPDVAYGKAPETVMRACNNDDDCENNVDGLRCIIVYPESFEPFCGCWNSDDCKSGVCVSSSKCR